MRTRTFAVKAWMAIVICLSLALSSSSAFARGNRDGHRDSHRENEYSRHETNRYGWSDWSNWLGFRMVFGSPSTGSFVMSLPFGYRTVRAGNTCYYYYDNVYYKPYSNGYIVVPEPIATPDYTYLNASKSGAVVINVPNSNGSFTSITLVRWDNGYVGPQGEYYPGNPTVEQLRALYGR